MIMAKMKRHAYPAVEKDIPKPTQPQKNDSPNDSSVSFYIPFIKADAEEQKVTGVVLQPDIVDAHGDVISEAVIAKAAHTFLDSFNDGTKLGEQHSSFRKQFRLCESYTMPVDVVIANKIIKKGTWMMVAKVLDSKTWQKVKNGKLTGFSIGGKAKVKQLQKPESGA
jgi:hypothetical protein